MTLLNVADCLADILDIENIYAGTIDGSQKECIGVYDAKTSAPYRLAIGGRECTKTKSKRITLLIRHTNNPTLAEIQAHKVLDALMNIRGYAFIGGEIKCALPDEPVYIGKDDKGICEYTINTKILYEESEE